LFSRAERLEQLQEVVENSQHEIDAFHQAFKKDCWESGKQLELLVDLERINEGHKV